MDYSLLDDKTLHDRLEKGVLAAEFLGSPHGKVLAEACRRIVDAEIKKFAFNTDVTDVAQIVRHQEILKMYGFRLFDELRAMVKDSEFAFDEAKDRGSLRQPSEMGERDSTP